MQHWHEMVVALVLIGTMLSFSPAHAGGEGPTPFVDPRMVLFRYDPNTTFTILTLPGVPTDIQLAADEKVTGLALGDTLQWMVEELPGHLFIKPIKGELFTAGTLVTDRRVYQLVFKSTSSQGRWVQKVSWSTTDASTDKEPNETAPGSSGAVDGLSPEALDPARLNFGYDIEGEGDFRPVVVFDDGRFTWIKVRAPQALPALFMVDDGAAVLVNYIIKGEYFVVQRLMQEILLKLGNTEIRVINKRYAKKSGRQEGTDILQGIQ
ncbi:MAG: TrbG/VirB9 family P-type conjugative transfer protein [Burkholderiales bacterium]